PQTSPRSLHDALPIWHRGPYPSHVDTVARADDTPAQPELLWSPELEGGDPPMPTRSFSPALFAYMRELRANNDREWFAANKLRRSEEHTSELQSRGHL